jgi:hypothetical protein
MGLVDCVEEGEDRVFEIVIEEVDLRLPAHVHLLETVSDVVVAVNEWVIGVEIYEEVIDMIELVIVVSGVVIARAVLVVGGMVQICCGTQSVDFVA